MTTLEIVLTVVTSLMSIVMPILVAKGVISKKAAKRMIALAKKFKDAGSNGAAAIVAELKENKAGDPARVVGAIDKMVREVKGKKKRPFLKRLGGFVLGKVLTGGL